MAIYHCSIKFISRGAGQSIIAAAAYRHACKLDDVRTGEVHDYTKKQGLESSAIYLPVGVNAEWAKDRSKLWNQVEASEKRVNSRLGRDVVLALPAELSELQRGELAGEMARHLADRYGVVVDVAIHLPSRHGDQRNHHAHMLMSSRRITAQGFGEKARELDDKERGPEEVEHIRAAWARMANRALERAGQHVQIDHRSLQGQGIKRLAPLHLGPSASAMERRGVSTRIGNRNRDAEQFNAQVEKIEAALALFNPAAQERQKWVERRKELRHKEKEAEKAAKDFFERAAQYEGRNGLFEAQREFDAIPVWKRIFFDREKSIQATVQDYDLFVKNYQEKGKEAQEKAREYAERGFKVALTHPEAQDNGDHIAIARYRYEQQLERERQKEAKKKTKRNELEKKYGAAIKKLVFPEAPSAGDSRVEYAQYLDKMQTATPEQFTEMVKNLQYAEHRYEVQKLFYDVATVVSRDTSISGRNIVRDDMLKKWDNAKPEQRKQLEQDAKEFIETHQRQRRQIGMRM